MYSMSGFKLHEKWHQHCLTRVFNKVVFNRSSLFITCTTRGVMWLILVTFEQIFILVLYISSHLPRYRGGGIMNHSKSMKVNKILGRNQQWPWSIQNSSRWYWADQIWWYQNQEKRMSRPVFSHNGYLHSRNPLNAD